MGLLLVADAQHWQATPDAGFYIKPLFHDEGTGETSFLMKMGPGDHVARAIGAEHEAGSRHAVRC